MFEFHTVGLRFMHGINNWWVNVVVRLVNTGIHMVLNIVKPISELINQCYESGVD